MGDPLERRDELEDALELAAREARAYLAGLPGDDVQPPDPAGALDGLGGELPEQGDGALADSAPEHGLAGAPQIPVLTSGYVHASAVKSLALLGRGKANVRRLSRDARGSLDLAAL